jgi:hypothetical protein
MIDGTPPGRASGPLDMLAAQIRGAVDAGVGAALVLTSLAITAAAGPVPDLEALAEIRSLATPDLVGRVVAEAITDLGAAAEAHADLAGGVGAWVLFPAARSEAAAGAEACGNLSHARAELRSAVLAAAGTALLEEVA